MFFRILIICILLLTGCSPSNTKEAYYLLENEVNSNPESISYIPIKVEPVKVPDYLDKTSVILNVTNNTVNYAENAFWSEPLGVSIARFMEENLSQRKLSPGTRIALRIDRFHANEKGIVHLSGCFRIIAANGDSSAPQAYSLNDQQAHKTVPALIITMKKLLVSLSEEITEAEEHAFTSKLSAHIPCSTVIPTSV